MTIGHKPLQEGEVLDLQLHFLWLASLHKCTGQHQKQQRAVQADNLKLVQLLLCCDRQWISSQLTAYCIKKN